VTGRGQLSRIQENTVMKVRTRSARWWLTWACLLMATPSLAADHYLNDRVLDGDVPLPGCPAAGRGADVMGCGSCDRPCETPGFLVASGRALRIGDTVYFNTGRYAPLRPLDPIVQIDLRGQLRPEGAWLTLTGPVDAQGRPLRDAGGLPLAVLDGRGEAPAGVVISGSWARLRALRLQGFKDAGGTTEGSAVLVLDSGVEGYDLSQLDIADVGAPGGSAIRVAHRPNRCLDCSIRDNRIHASTSSEPAIWVESQDAVRIVGNHISGWGDVSGASGIRAVGNHVEILHNVIQGGGGAAVEAQAPVRISHNTFRANARVPLTTAADLKGVELVVLGTRGAFIDHNILAPRPGRVALAVEELGLEHVIDFNGYAVDEADVAYTARDLKRYPTLEVWQEASGWEARSRTGQPRFASDIDAHLRSVSGRWNGGRWVSDTETSDFIDVGDPFALSGETHFLHGEAPNLGAYGNTAEASLSVARLVTFGGGELQGEVGLPLPLRVEVRGLNPRGGLHPSYPNVPILFRVVSGAAELSETRLVTDSAGRAQVELTPREAGTVLVEASVEGVPGVVPLLLEATILGDTPGPTPEPGTGRAHYTVGFGCTQAAAPALPLGLMALAWLLCRRRWTAPRR
jgi:uncharacterized protein (TIGR03382 family)